LLFSADATVCESAGKILANMDTNNPHMTGNLR